MNVMIPAERVAMGGRISPLFGFQAVPLNDGLAGFGDHVLPVFGLGGARTVLSCKKR